MKTQWTGRVVTDTRGDEALAGAWWRCGDDGEGWITDVEIAVEYLYAAAHEN